MNPIAIIQTDSPSLDAVILWDDGSRLIAMGYQDGKTTMSRPLTAVTLADAKTETLNAFTITEGRYTEINEYRADRVAVLPARWG